MISKPSQVYKKNALVNEGNAFNKEVFIVEGVVRAYTLDEAGHERTTAFYQAYDFMNINTLRNQDGYTISTYQVILDSVVIIIEADKFRNLLDKYPVLMKLASLIKNHEVDRLKNRDDCLLQVAGIEKYLKFKEHYPGIEDKIPHYYIASYLGISPVSLSRARKKIQAINV
jgi:CRP-like cAMP-binding protein